VDYIEVLPNLFLGSCPENRNDVLTLASTLKITAVLNVQTDDDMRFAEIKWSEICREYVRTGIQLRRVQIVDFDPTDLKDKLPLAVRTLDTLMKGGKITYVHCTAGHSRAPTTVAAYLSWCADRELGEVIKFLRERRTCLPDRKAIEGARIYFK
jgi:hypothetical protein